MQENQFYERIYNELGLTEKSIQKLKKIFANGSTPLTDLINILIEQEAVPPKPPNARKDGELEQFYRECEENGDSRLLSAICGYFRYQSNSDDSIEIKDIYDTWEKCSATLTFHDIGIMLESNALAEIEDNLKILKSKIPELWGEVQEK